MGRSAESATLSVPKWLQNRVQLWLKRSGLAEHWQVTILFKQKVYDRGECAAVTQITPGYNTAVIVFSKSEYDDASEYEVDLLICHELFHLVAARICEELEAKVGLAAVYKAVDKEIERAADVFAIMLVKAYRRKKE